ncbi:hypothetical protein NHU86_12235 [Aeromonas caviae]|uniref:hypothetical protein n=1 Tax=Aeromonas caviae TaxID=648 RepID=UPI0030820B05|nr:hypothetical protein NHU86_12235 [Aeromonas caviae]
MQVQGHEKENVLPLLQKWILEGFNPEVQSGLIALGRMDDVKAWRIVPAIEALNGLVFSAILDGEQILSGSRVVDHIHLAITSVNFDKKTSSSATVTLDRSQLSDEGAIALGKVRTSS